MAQQDLEAQKLEAQKKEWCRPVLRKLPIAETAAKQKGNEGQGTGKGENVLIS